MIVATPNSKRNTPNWNKTLPIPNNKKHGKEGPPSTEQPSWHLKEKQIRPKTSFKSMKKLVKTVSPGNRHHTKRDNNQHHSENQGRAIENNNGTKPKNKNKMPPSSQDKSTQKIHNPPGKKKQSRRQSKTNEYDSLVLPLTPHYPLITTHPTSSL